MSARPPWWLWCALLLVACASVLGIRSSNARPFEHRAHVTRGVACTSCHARVARSGADAAPDLPDERSCRSCHAQPHDPRPCSGCHGRPEDRRHAAMAKEHLAFSHRDHAATAAGSCTRCHGSVLSQDAPLTPPMATCLRCHEHRQQWAARACTPCHRNLEDEQVRPSSHLPHGESFLGRHGLAAAGARDLCGSCHAESECAGCHGVSTPGLPSTLRFDQPQRPDMHPAGFAARHALEAGVDPALCASCHREPSFCRDCHARRGLLEVTTARGSPHPADWTSTDPARNRHGEEARRNPVSCASCHGGEGEALCVGCHRVGGPGGSPHPAGFSSSKPPSERPCRLCHAEGP
jgi:hypothetical protein